MSLTLARITDQSLVSDDRRKYGNIDISSRPRASWSEQRGPRPSVASDIPSQTISWHGGIIQSDFQHDKGVKWPRSVCSIKKLFRFEEEAIVSVSWYEPMLVLRAREGGTDACSRGQGDDRASQPFEENYRIQQNRDRHTETNCLDGLTQFDAEYKTIGHIMEHLA